MKIQVPEGATLWPIEKLLPYDRNPRTHSEAQLDQIEASIVEFGFVNPIIVSPEQGVIAGHGRLEAAKRLEMPEIPVTIVGHLSETQQRAYVIADNQLAINAGWEISLLQTELEDLKDLDFNLDILGFSDDEYENLLGSLGGGEGGEAGDVEGFDPRRLADQFGIPPFSVFNAREGWWRERKRQWQSLGIESEVGRGDNLQAFSETILKSATGSWSGTSIFDPVLCELVYRWFSPNDGVVIDPFAGGSVRGIVAAKLGRQYIGVDLRPEQIEENREQALRIVPDNQPIWYEGDSIDIRSICEAWKADLIFTCPPYADLERYSDDERDLSTMQYQEFRKAYRKIIDEACHLLKPNRFACIVVGEVRGKGGAYYNFVGDTVSAFLDAGMSYYNEAILVTDVATMAMRAGKMFSTSRKLGKTHQNVLVFVKGEGRQAAEDFGECVFGSIEDGGQREQTEYGEKITIDDLGGEVA